MTAHVHLTVEVTGGGIDRLVIELDETVSGDNPLYAASIVREAIANAAIRADGAVVGVHGDIGDRAVGKYTPRLPTAPEWRNAAIQHDGQGESLARAVRRGDRQLER